MRILAAHVFQFRNVASAQLTFSPRLTAFVGPNGQGKTNILEALYSVAALRPLRNVPRSELIHAEHQSAAVLLSVQAASTGLTHELRLDLRRGGRTLTKDGKRCEAGAFLGHLVTVAFTPDDLEISKGAPEVRRRFLDRALLNTRPAYLAIALRYARALKGRNRLLIEQQSDAVLDAYDHALATAGAAVLTARARYVAELAPRIVRSFDEIAAPAPPLTVRYRTSLADAADAASESETQRLLHDRLVERRRRDRARGTTSVGPHLDDLEITLGGAASKVRASQGQHRALVLAIKLAEIAHLTEVLGEPPVLLLDDISSELDADRSRQLFAAVAPLEGQVILTTTELAQVPGESFGGGVTPLIHRVHGGAVEQIAGEVA